MRSVIALIVLAALLVGCGGDSSLEVEIFPNADFAADVYTFTATGAAVDEGLMCGSGAWIWLGNETVDGEPMPNSDIAAMVDAGEDFEMVVVSEFECDDGSGSIVVAEQTTVDPADPSSAEPGETVASWTVRSGSVNGDTIEGEGDTIGAGDIQVSGEQTFLTGSLTSG